MATTEKSAFFCYSREDTDFSRRLAGDLKAAGADVWLDRLDIRPGQPWDDAVQDALKSCPRLLLVLSPSSVASQNVLDEVSFAIDERKAVIPVLYRDCQIPMRVRRLQYIDFRTDYQKGLLELLKTLRGQAEGGAATFTFGPVGAVGPVAAVRSPIEPPLPTHEVTAESRTTSRASRGFPSTLKYAALAALIVIVAALLWRAIGHKDIPATPAPTLEPRALSLSPASGMPDTPVTITGLNFGATQGNSTVRFGSVTAPVTYWSANSIVARVPILGPGTEDAVVSVSGVDSSPLKFLVKGRAVNVDTTAGMNKSGMVSPEYQRVKDRLYQTQAQASAVFSEWNQRQAAVRETGGSLRSDEQTALNLLRSSMNEASRSLQSGNTAGASHNLDTAEQQIKLLQRYAE